MNDRVYTPDKWVVLHHPEHDVHTILGGWYGGYLHGDSWRRSTAIQKVEEDDDSYTFTNMSGSVYKCYKAAYGWSGIMLQVHSHVTEELPALTEEEAIKFIDILQKENNDNEH